MPLTLSQLLELLARPLLFVVYALAGCLPRDPRRWVFGSWSGHRYADNAAALFEYLQAHGPGSVRGTWITRDPAIRDRLRRRGLPVAMAWSPRGLWACARAGIYVYDGLSKDVNHWLCRGARKVLLRHGVGMKRVERAIDNPRHRLYQLFHGNLAQRLFWRLVIPWHLVRPDLAMATSPEHAQQGELYYGIPPDRIVVTGFPRNDALLAGHTPGNDDTDAAWIRARQAAGRRVYLYLPTFRDDTEHFSLPWAGLSALAGRLGIAVLVKLHYVDAMRGLATETGDDTRLRIGQADADPNRLFNLVDGLISDYSSASFDFVLTGKPVVYFIPDAAAYQRFSRGLLYDFDSVTPGPKARNLAELEAALAAARDDRLQEWRDAYEALLQRFHTWRDPHASARVMAAICRHFGLQPAAGPSPDAARRWAGETD